MHKKDRRVKDLYDLAFAWSTLAQPDHLQLWRDAARHFRDACRTRDVEFRGSASFAHDIDTTRALYQRDEALAALPWETTWPAVEAIVALWAEVLAQAPPDAAKEPVPA